MIIFCTAGHIDAGKTSLVRAISGFEGDSTPQERERGITIDLSFSDFEGISFVDVPGHENLLKTAIAGLASEYALLVIDINEGLMPQSAEHIFALKIMGARHIVAVLNKCDKCEDIAGKKAQILGELEAMGCELAAVFCLSAKTGEGMDALKAHLRAVAAGAAGGAGGICEKTGFSLGVGGSALSLRVFVDRVFSVAGVGEVATGLLESGELAAGEFAASCAQKIAPLKIRSLQVQHEPASSAAAPARVAFCFRGKLEPGSVVFAKGELRFASEIYASAQFLGAALSDGAQAVFCSHNQVSAARVFAAGEFVKIELEKPLLLRFGDKFLLLANGRIAGGGAVLSPLCEPLKKRKMVQLLRALQAGDFAAAFGILNLAHPGGFGLFSAPQRFNLRFEEAAALAQESCQIVNTAGGSCYTNEHLHAVTAKIRALFEQNKFSLQSAKSLAISLKEEEFLCQKALENLRAAGLLRAERGLFLRADVSMQEASTSAAERLFERIDCLAPAAPYNIYDELNLDRAQGDKILKNLCAVGKCARLAHNYFISAAALKAALKNIEQIATDCGGVGVQELKARLGLSRKYAIALLEYADALPNVRREGDKRFFKEKL